MPLKQYDITLSSPFSNYDFFAHRLRELCGQMGMTLFIVDDVWVKEFTQKLQAKEISVRVLFSRLCSMEALNSGGSPSAALIHGPSGSS